FSAPSARPKEKAPGSYYPPATVKPWRFIWRKSRLRSRPARTLSFFLIRRDGMSRRGFPSQTTSRSCRCRRNRPSSIRSRTSGNSCAPIGSRTASSNPTTTSSTIAASPGISSSTCPGKSCPSGPETGSTGHDHQDLVLSDSPWQAAFERFAMSTPVPLRSDFDTIGLRMLARRSRDPDQTRRLLALAEIYDGGSRPDAARIGGGGGQIVRDWGVRFNAKGPDGLLTGKAPGAPSILDERQRQALRQVVVDGPIPALHGVVRWRLIDLAQWLFEEFR